MRSLLRVARRILILIDRDGVIIQNVQRPGNVVGSARRLSEVKFIDGSIEACKKLRDFGLTTAIVTNQPDVSRNQISFKQALAISNHVKTTCEINSVFICPHDTEDNCSCRKPKPGLLLKAIELYKPAHVVMIGDRLTDVIAGNLVGATTVHIDESKNVAPIYLPPSENLSDANIVCSTLLAAVNEVLQLLST